MTDQSRAKDDDRLRGWKEIAAALHASERTAQRWEETMGLPVHRVPAARGDQVFAYRSELDAWVASDHIRELRDHPDGRPDGEERAYEAVAELPRSTRRATASRWGVVPALAVLGASLVVVLGVLWGTGEDGDQGRRPSGAVLASGERSEPPAAERRQAAKPILLKVTANGVPSVIGVAEGKLGRISVPGHGTTLGVIPRALPGKVAVRLFRIEGTTVSGEPLVAEVANRELVAGLPSRCDVGPVEVLLEWLPSPQSAVPKDGTR